MQTHFDVIVIGAGSGGLTAAVGAANIGKKVLLIEADQLGGECTNAGCIPSKALLHHAKTYHQAVTIAGSNQKTAAYRDGAFTYVRSIVDSVREHEKPTDFAALGIEVVMGKAEFTGTRSLKVGKSTYHFDHAVVATGSTPRLLEIPGLSSITPLTNQNLFELKSLPERLLIIGGGPIGLEMSQAFAYLGVEVTLATIEHELATFADPALRPLLTTALNEAGVKIETYADIAAIENSEAVFNRRDGDNIIDTFRLPFDKLLVAIGRTPNLPTGLNLANINNTKHGIVTDSQYRTTNRHVYAVGDVTERLKFTHTADDAARQVITRLASRGFLRVNRHKAVPKVIYTEPELAQIGLSTREAEKRFGPASVRRIEVPLSLVDRARTDNTNGLLIVNAKRISGRIIGAEYFGSRAGEIITTLSLAVDRRLTLYQLRRLIIAYPTYALMLKKAGDLFLATQLRELPSDLFNLAKRIAPKLVVAALWATALWFLYSYQNNHNLSATDTAFMVFDFVTMTVWGPLIYILAYAIRPVTFFPATALTILCGIFFGFWYGTVLTIIAANLSALVAYGVGRFFGSDITFEDSRLGSWVDTVRENTFSAVLTMRLIFLPFDGISYLAGLLKAPVLPFSFATMIGTVLGIATFISIGTSLDVESFRANGISADVIDVTFIILSAAIFTASLIVSKLLQKKQKTVA